MSARASLRDFITASAPEAWEIYGYPTQLGPFEDASKPVAIVIEQRTMTAGRTSPDENGIPIDIELTVWVIVDATRGDNREQVENQLEDAAEQMILILEAIPDQWWDGVATRNQYDPQKPAYDFTIRAAGALTQEEQE
ncbi:hypothetical protein [Microbacterium sp. CR_7]|uniref:hypothetical protein n=1 Tax=Microbacterium sp. CR_7 TaxID=3055792 RepID=UPI0035C0E321